MAELRQTQASPGYTGPEVQHNRYLAAITGAFKNLQDYLAYTQGEGGTGQKLTQVLEANPNHFLRIAVLAGGPLEIGYALLEQRLVLAFSDGSVSPLTAEKFKELMLKYEDQLLARQGKGENQIGLFGMSTIDGIVHTAIGTPRDKSKLWP